MPVNSLMILANQETTRAYQRADLIKNGMSILGRSPSVMDALKSLAAIVARDPNRLDVAKNLLLLASRRPGFPTDAVLAALICTAG